MQHTLATQDFELVRMIARRVKRSLGARVAMEDLEAHGMEGLLAAVGRFDPARGASFSTFAGYRIRGAMIDALRQMSQRPHDPIDGHAIPSSELGAEEASLRREARQRVRRALAKLPRRERTFIDRIYVDGEQMNRAGAELGISPSWSSRLHARTLARLRRDLND